MMRRIKVWIKSFFGFSQTETTAFLILIPLLVILIFAEPAYQYWFVRQPQDFSKEAKELDSLIATFKWEQKDSIEKKSTALFSFDPNTASKEQLNLLGLEPHLANRIIHYRNKGGKFLIKKDLQKMYGMDTAIYMRLLPFINLPNEINLVKEVKESTKPIAKPKPTIEKFDLNLADTVQLIAVYGIGSKLSKRIIAYREKLGGFISNEQLHEVYGLDSAVIQKLEQKFFIDNRFKPRQLDLNKTSEKELAQHPYIKFKLAKLISAYAFQHGRFQSVDELKKMAVIDEIAFQKIKPYVTANP